MWAAENGHLDIVDSLLKKKGIDVNLQNVNGYTALMLATQRGHLDVVNRLLEENVIDVNIQDNDGNTAWNLYFK